MKLSFTGIMSVLLFFGLHCRYQSENASKEKFLSRGKAVTPLGTSELDSLFSDSDSVNYISEKKDADSGYFQMHSYKIGTRLGVVVFAADLSNGADFNQGADWIIRLRKDTSAQSGKSISWHYCKKVQMANKGDSLCSKEFRLNADTIELLRNNDSSMIIGVRRGSFILQYYDYRFPTSSELKGYAEYQMPATLIFRRLRSRIYIFMVHGLETLDSIPSKVVLNLLR